MDAGVAMEFDHPHILLQNKRGIFTNMVDKTGPHMAETLKSIAKEVFKSLIPYFLYPDSIYF